MLGGPPVGIDMNLVAKKVNSVLKSYSASFSFFSLFIFFSCQVCILYVYNRRPTVWKAGGPFNRNVWKTQLEKPFVNNRYREKFLPNPLPQ